MKLYEISQDLLRVLQSYDNGEIDQEQFVSMVQDLKGDFNGKADNVASLIKSLNAEVNAIKEEIKGLQARAKAKENQVENLTGYLSMNFEALGLKKLETSKNVVSFKKCPPKVIIENEAEFMLNNKEEFTKVAYSIDKTKLKDHLKQGEIIEGAKLVQDMKINIK